MRGLAFRRRNVLHREHCCKTLARRRFFGAGMSPPGRSLGVANYVFRSTLGGMAYSSRLRHDGEKARQYFRRLRRRDYLTEYEQERRRQAKAEGSRRIDVTLNAKALDDYATVLAWLKGLNRHIATFSKPLPPTRLSATEIIRMALNYAASDMREEDDKAAKTGGRRMLDE
jgi:hypothetical protein